MPMLLNALRPHQWVKNVLVFVPVFAAHQFANPEKMGAALWAFVAFSMVASAVYLTNDLLDREADRQHPLKRHRPIASGALGVGVALGITALLLVGGLGLGTMLGWDFAILLTGYFALSLAYSWRLKSSAPLDLVLLATFYTVRVIAGGIATEIVVSVWLFVFAAFFFFSLAHVKRLSELVAGVNSASMRRGYTYGDEAVLLAVGAASGFLSVLVVALYVTSPDVVKLYGHPHLLLLVCPVLMYWISRVWLLAHRGQVHFDPIVFACKDRQSWVCGVALLVCLFFAR